MIASGQLAPFTVLVISIITLAVASRVLYAASACKAGNYVLQPVKSEYTVRDGGRVSHLQAEGNFKRLLLRAVPLTGLEKPDVRTQEGL